MLWVRVRQIEARQDGVALELRNGAPVTLDRLGNGSEVFIERFDECRRFQAFADGCEPLDIDEKDRRQRNFALTGLHAFLGRTHPAHDLARHETREILRRAAVDD